MAENETLPKSKKSADWLAYADAKLAEFKAHHGKRDVLGGAKNPPPLQDDYSKLLSTNELQARKIGMELLRKERAEASRKPKGYREGGRVEKSGPAVLHRGERVVRSKSRKPSRKSSRR
jgi:hypothetical protein